MDRELQNRIERSSTPEPNSGCWLWDGSVGATGYGAIGIFNKKVAAHRASYIAFLGEIPDNRIVLHGCDTKACVNPQHLTLGTHSDNAIDRMKRGNSVQSDSELLRTRGIEGAARGSWGMKLDLKERLDRLSIFEPNTGCQLWIGTVVKTTGYGEIKVRGKKTSAHRAMWIAHHGVPPSGMVVMHSCDVRICINIDHLSIGSRKDNSSDMSRKGRGFFNRLSSEMRSDMSQRAMRTIGPEGLKERAAKRVANTTAKQRSDTRRKGWATIRARSTQ